jgi:quercetin dioxygenase-like cupin family protein
MSGTVDFHVGDEAVRLGPGGLRVVPPNVTHYAKIVGDEPPLDLDVFTSNRPEYAPAPQK